MTWLIVDAEPETRDILELMVTRWGYEPLTFAGCDAAFRRLEDVISGAHSGPPPGLALLDTYMPGMTDNQLAVRMRQAEALKDMAIVLMTAFNLTDTERQHILSQTGADALFMWPLPRTDELQATLEGILSRRASQRETAGKVGCD